MNSTSVVYTPIILPIDDPLREWNQHILNEFVACSEQITPLCDWGKVSPMRLQVFDEPSEYPEFDQVWSPASARRYAFLRVECATETDPIQAQEQLIRDNPHLSSKDLQLTEASIHRSATVPLSRAVADLVLTANIAKPGCLEVDSRIVFVETTSYEREDPGMLSAFYSTHDRVRELGWPLLTEIDFIRCWNWFQQIPGISIGVGQGPAGRAVSAFSYLFRPDAGELGAAMDLVWALIGLESLYARGNTGLKEQLLEKSEVILGPRHSHKKRFGEMYDFRSRFVHGDVNFPLAYSPYDALAQFEEFMLKEFDSMHTAIAMLTATLQWLVTHEAYELRFRYTIDK